MSTLRNSVQLIGNLGKAPEVKKSSNGTKYVTFSLATTDNYTTKSGDKVKETTWHNITVFNSQADIAEKYLSTGSQVGITAKLVNNEYTDKDGNKKIAYNLKVIDLVLLGNGNKTPQSVELEKVLVEADGGDGLPF